MPWAKFDDRLHTHRKIMQIDNDAMAVWVCSVTYCAENLTDGFLTEGEADRLLALRNAPKQIVKQLLQVCLWENAANGYRVHDFLDYNPSREDALKLKDERAAAGSVGGKRSGETRRNKSRSKNEANALASAQAKTKQNRTPYPDPVPVTSITNVIDGATVEEKNAAHAAPLDAAAPSSLRAQRTAILDQLLYTKGNRERIGLLQRAVGLSLGEETDIQPGLLAKLAKDMGAGELCKLIFSCGLKYEGIDSAASYLSAAAAKHHTDLKATRNGHAPPEPQYRPADTEEERAEKIRKELEWAAEHTIPPSYMRTRTNGASSHRASATSRGEFSPRSEDT